jgi:hypothetical protein
MPSYTETPREETEERIIQRAQRESRVAGSIRRVSFWADDEGIRIVMTNKRREVMMRYTENDNPGILAVMMRKVMDRLGRKTGRYLVDTVGRRFPDNDALYTYFSQPGCYPIRMVQGFHLDNTTTRAVSKPEDKIERIEVHFGDVKQKYERHEWRSYVPMVARARLDNHFPET